MPRPYDTGLPLHHARHRFGGFVLVIVVAVLGILAYLALNVAKVAHDSRGLSLHGLHLAKARLSARSALEKGMTFCDRFGNAGVVSGFQLRENSAGDDINRSGDEDAGEDAAGDGFSRHVPLEHDRTPSLALEDPSTPGSALNHLLDGRPLGASWRNGADADQWALLRINRPCLGLNAGVTSGRGAEGARYQADFGLAYSASDFRHPFNRPVVNLLNAWGNYHKYRAMVRTDKTYDFNSEIDHNSNLGIQSAGSGLYFQNPHQQFDRFIPSGNHPSSHVEIPLGDLLVSQRPAEGYKSLDIPVAILKQYVDLWRDKNGTWLYADGGAIPVPTPAVVAAIVEEFKSLVTLEPGPDLEPVYRRGHPGPLPPAPAFDAAEEIAFSSHAGRQLLNTRIYRVDGFRVDVNAAPVSVLAALIHGVTVDFVRRYKPDEAYTATLTADSTIRRVHPLLHNTLTLHLQSENNHPCYYTYGNNNRYGFIYRAPLFSMTESIRMAEDVVALRTMAPFQGPSDFMEYLRKWNKGYDAKDKGVNSNTAFKFSSTLGAPNLNQAYRYRDVVQQNRRGRILGYLLNPKPMSNELIWDDALPKSIDAKLHGLGGMGPYQGNESFDVRSIFDLFDPHEIAGHATFSTESFHFQCLGIQSASGRRLASAMLAANRDLFQRLEIFSQRDFMKACTDPVSGSSTMGSHWVTYPEMPGVPPSTWEGQIALRPRQQECPFGNTLLLRAPLSGYESEPAIAQADLWPKGPRNLLGPGSNPARGKFLNSLKPAPGEAIPSLFPSNYSEVDSASDLMPGGGIRVSPYHNCFYRTYSSLSIGYHNRKEALLVLRNARVSDAVDAALPVPDPSPYVPPSIDPGPVAKVLPSFLEGGVSFYFKPRFSVAYVPINNHAQTLFYTPFIIEDEETKNRLATLSIPDPDEVRATYTSSMRLLLRSLDDNTFPVSMKLDRVYAAGAWPWVQPFEQGAGPVPHQSATAPHLFADMTGYNAFPGPGQDGYLMTRFTEDPGTAAKFFDQNGSTPNGDIGNIEGHWGAPRPHAAEALEIEFLITKFAQSVEVLNATNSTVNPTYQSWDALDEMTPLGLRCAYENPAATGLYLLDTCDPARPDYHTVRKSFILGHPWSAAPATRGQGPLDRNGNHQCLVEPGRWNHIFMAWRNLHDLLNNGSSHKGGCLAVWVNGTFKKVLAGSSYEVAGLFFQQDFYPGYRSATGLYQPIPSNYWYNPLYQAVGYSINLEQTTTQPTFHLQTLYTGSRNYLQMAPMGTDTATYLMNVSYMRPANQLYNVKKERLYTHFPSRFHFGHEPVTNLPLSNSNYFVSNMTWGAYMDVQIFDKADPALLHVDGGFNANPILPTYDSFSVYSPDTSGNPPLRMHPGNLAPDIHRVVSLAWSASLPEYHHFWDDQNDVVPGPDDLDSQYLTLSASLGAGALVDFQLSQDPTAAVPVYRWAPPEPMKVASASDLKLELHFKGPAKVYATPLVHGIEVIYKKRQPPPLKGFIWE